MKQKTNQKYTLHIHGMHCKSCVIITEAELKAHPNIDSVHVDLHKKHAEISGDFGNKNRDEILQELSPLIEKHGYKLSLEGEIKNRKLEDFKIAIPIAIGFAILFVILQKIGLVNLTNTQDITYGTIFVIGIIASLSTCMAVVGGLVLSISATFAKEGDKLKPQLLFHIGRIVSFFLLGGTIGLVGATFTLSTGAMFGLNLLIGLVMLVLGLNLLDLFHFTKKLQPTMPKFIAKHAHGITKFNHTFTPFLIGIATFFLPCGFTQAMQIYTLTTGSFLEGGLTMLLFALGTLPVLALMSFSSFSIKNKRASGIFFKSAGLIVIMFAVFNIINSLVVINILPPIFNI